MKFSILAFLAAGYVYKSVGEENTVYSHHTLVLPLHLSLSVRLLPRSQVVRSQASPVADLVVPVVLEVPEVQAASLDSLAECPSQLADQVVSQAVSQAEAQVASPEALQLEVQAVSLEDSRLVDLVDSPGDSRLEDLVVFVRTHI